MFAIDDEKLPPPTPATAATINNVLNATPGRNSNPASTHGTSRIAALNTVQLRPPKRVTARVYGMRSIAPVAAGTVVSRNFCAGSKPYCGPRKRTKTDHRLHTENPT